MMTMIDNCDDHDHGYHDNCHDHDEHGDCESGEGEGRGERGGRSFVSLR